MRLILPGLAVVCLLFFFASPVMAQIAANRLCIHNGADYYIIGFDHNSPNLEYGKYFPSFAHISSTPDNSSGTTQYPWKIMGWSWSGMQAGLFGPNWHWATALQKSKDMPYSTTMTWEYPYNYFAGISPHSGLPNPLYGGTVPTSVGNLPTAPSHFSAMGVGMMFPSSAGGFDQYMNIMAAADLTMNLPSTQPYYGWHFGLSFPAASAVMVPSSHSVWEYVWTNVGNLPYAQYLLMDPFNMDCTGTLGGNKGKSYSLIGGVTGGYFGYFDNLCTGSSHEFGMCLLVKDAVCVPTNVYPGVSGPFGAYGFDVGSGTVTPNISSGQFSMQAMYESYAYNGHSYTLLATSPSLSNPLSYGFNQYRVPGWDYITDIFVGMHPVWMAPVAGGYPAAMFGTTVGGHTIAVPTGLQPALVGNELTFYGFDVTHGPPTAGYMVTFF